MEQDPSPGPSREESSDDLSADDGDSTFSEVDSYSSSYSSSFENQDTMDDTADDEPTNDDNNQTAAANNIEDSTGSWSNVCASQRLYPFTGKQQLVIKSRPAGSDNSVTLHEAYSLFQEKQITRRSRRSR